MANYPLEIAAVNLQRPDNSYEKVSLLREDQSLRQRFITAVARVDVILLQAINASNVPGNQAKLLKLAPMLANDESFRTRVGLQALNFASTTELIVANDVGESFDPSLITDEQINQILIDLVNNPMLLSTILEF